MENGKLTRWSNSTHCNYITVCPHSFNIDAGAQCAPLRGRLYRSDTNGAPSRRTLRDSVSLYLSVSIFAGMYRIGKLLSTASYPLTNPDLTAIILKLIHKCREKEEYFSFARLERVRSVQAPRRGRRRSLWSRTAEFSLSCSV